MFMSHMKAAPVEAEVQKTEEELAEEEEQRLQLLKMEERLKKTSQSEHGTPSPEEVEEEEEELSSDDDKEVHDDDENDEDDVANALASNAAVMNFAKMFSNVKVVKPIEAVRQRINRDTTHFEKIKRAEYGLNIGTLRGWKAERMAELERDEVSRQEIAVSKVGSFMDAIGTAMIFYCIDVFSYNYVCCIYSEHCAYSNMVSHEALLFCIPSVSS